MCHVFQSNTSKKHRKMISAFPSNQTLLAETHKIDQLNQNMYFSIAMFFIMKISDISTKVIQIRLFSIKRLRVGRIGVTCFSEFLTSTNFGSCKSFGSLIISARSGCSSCREVSKPLRQLKTAVTKISIYSSFAEIVKEPKFLLD